MEVKATLLDMGYDWEKFPFELPLDIKWMIQAIPIVITSRGVEKLAWAGSPFNLRSAYRIAMGIEDSPHLFR